FFPHTLHYHALHSFPTRRSSDLVDDRPLRSGEFHPLSFRGRVQPLAGQEHAGLRELFIVPAHFGQKLPVRHDAPFRFLARFDDDHESHVSLLCLTLHGSCRTGRRAIDRSWQRESARPWQREAARPWYREAARPWYREAARPW